MDHNLARTGSRVNRVIIAKAIVINNQKHGRTHTQKVQEPCHPENQSMASYDLEECANPSLTPSVRKFLPRIPTGLV